MILFISWGYNNLIDHRHILQSKKKVNYVGFNDLNGNNVVEVKFRAIEFNGDSLNGVECGRIICNRPEIVNGW